MCTGRKWSGRPDKGAPGTVDGEAAGETSTGPPRSTTDNRLLPRLHNFHRLKHLLAEASDDFDPRALERVSRWDRSGPPSASGDDGYDCATELVPLTVHKHLHKRTRGGEGFIGSLM